MKIETICRDARRSLDLFCKDECSSYCCRKGQLVLNDKDMDFVCQDKRKKLEKDGFITDFDDKFILKLKNNLGGCPSFKDNRCIIHKSRKRPRICKDFPVFLRDDTVELSTGCYAVKAGLLFRYAYKIRQLGYKILMV